MERSKEFEEAFKEAKMVYLTTYSKDGDENTRPMTNYSESPYDLIWFPTEKSTQKVKNPNGDGYSAKRIVDIMEKIALSRQLVQKKITY